MGLALLLLLYYLLLQTQSFERRESVFTFLQQVPRRCSCLQKLLDKHVLQGQIMLCKFQFLTMQYNSAIYFLSRKAFLGLKISKIALLYNIFKYAITVVNRHKQRQSHRLVLNRLACVHEMCQTDNSRDTNRFLSDSYYTEKWLLRNCRASSPLSLSFFFFFRNLQPLTCGE